MFEQVKGALQSYGILGSLTSIGSLFGGLTYLWDIYASIPPELIHDTRVFFTVTVVALIASFVSLVGRWRAVTKIEGILPKK